MRKNIVKYGIVIALLAGSTAGGHALANRFANRLYLNGLWGVSYVAKEDVYYTYHGGNFGWHGVIGNNREDYWGSGFGSYNLGFFAEGGFYRYYGKPSEGKADEFSSLKFSLGLSVGHYFVFYVKPNLFLHNFETMGISATSGVKIHLFLKDIALAYGIAVDFLPIFYVFGDADRYPVSVAGIHLTVDIVYEINRTKRKQ